MRRSVAYIECRQSLGAESLPKNGKYKSVSERLAVWERFNKLIEQKVGRKDELLPLGLVPAVQK